MRASPKIKFEVELPRYGIGLQSVQMFRDRATPEQINYLDLIEPQGPQADSLLRPDGVVQNQDRPLLFFINQSRLAESDDQKHSQIRDLRRALACRGDRAYLAVMRPGSLDVIPVSLKDKMSDWKPYTVVGGTADAITFFSRLAQGTFEGVPTGAEVDYLFKEIFDLVDKTSTKLANLKIKRSDVISLVGRVLFFRFLRDRGIIKESDRKKIAPKAASLAHCFDDAENTAATCQWLDKTFNGDFLPLTDGGSREFFTNKSRISGKKLFHYLKAILRADEATDGDGYQGRLDFNHSKFEWGHLDFAHIPVGLLSQVYEKLSWKWNRERSKKTSVHYTPRNIAATLVGEAFDQLKDAHAAKVLDPACGASVFLVLAFRRLYQELWNHSKKRPDTRAIRNILENQLVGFDICDSALKLSALSLYLTAIELDPDPSPPEKLTFKALCQGPHARLFDWRLPADNEKGPVVGSLGEHVGNSFNGQFDLILCNPPWTNLGKPDADVATEIDRISQSIVTRLDPEIGRIYKNPDSVPDLPFIWKSMEWCKPGGRIAMALPARTLFKQGKMAGITRKALFSLLEINGIINCSNLRKTKVWPEMNQPFMLLFATNQRPKPNHRLHFISPQTDFRANSLGEMRIDPKSAQLVDVLQTFDEPWLWKALGVGTALDVEVVRKIKKLRIECLKTYWTKDLNLVSKRGYEILASLSEQQDSTAMKCLKDLNSTSTFRFVVNTEELDYFQHDTLGWSRIDYADNSKDPIIAYRGPLALIKEAPGADRRQGWALYCESDLAYTRSFYGYSANGADNAEMLVRYLQLFVHSQIWIYYALMTSGKLGFERPNVYKADLDNCPFFPFENLDQNDRDEVKSLSSRLIKGDRNVFSDIDVFFGRLYGLKASDVEVIRDTLEVREPNDELGKRASQPPDLPEREMFFDRLESYLSPFFRVLKRKPKITVFKPLADDPKNPFLVFTLSCNSDQDAAPSEIFQTKILPLANQTGAAQIIEQTESGLVIALLGQYRYWTPSRARMLGAHILREHMQIFEG